MNFMKLMWDLLRCGSGILLFVLLLSGQLCAQTDVAGEVSGEWNSDGNPYVITDSTWIPEGEELIINQAVDVLFQENQGLYVYGSIETHGDKYEAPVTISLFEGAEHWKGIRFFGEVSGEFTGTWIDYMIPDTIFFLDRGCALRFDDCELQSSEVLAKVFLKNLAFGLD